VSARVEDVTFRSMAAGDLPLLHEWLQRPHVRRWWGEPASYKATVEHYSPALRGDEPVDLSLIVLDGQPVGFIQRYLTENADDLEPTLPAGARLAGVDLFIAEVGLTGKGLGTRVLRTFVRDRVFCDTSIVACIADPAVRNEPSLRAFGKAGFVTVKTYLDEESGETHALMSVRRPQD
jgi:RimJ/RimL family protein N-acetyltransferase